ncbi:MAG: hypothetical protein KBS91_04155 [Firmicutes bacterium]|nr:hypothetical protein [Candidatus Caballimonas caccae]
MKYCDKITYCAFKENGYISVWAVMRTNASLFNYDNEVHIGCTEYPQGIEETDKEYLHNYALIYAKEKGYIERGYNYEN